MTDYSYDFVKIIKARKEYVSEKLLLAKKEHKKLHSLPPHKLRVQRHGNVFQYYLRDDDHFSRGKYIKKEKLPLVQSTIQKEYLDHAIDELEKELSVLNSYIQNCSPQHLPDLYTNSPQGRKVLIKPLEISNEDFAVNWAEVSYTGKMFSEDSAEFYTNKNERVRSKSEVIIANMLNKYNIPYRYEYPIQVKGMGTVFPDFTILNIRKRKEIYLEHFGLIDNQEYRENALRKLAMYEQSGIYLGDNLIATWESNAQPLDMKCLERKIKKYLL